MFNAVPDGFRLQFRRSRQGFPRVQHQVKTLALQPDLNGHLGSIEYMHGEDIPDTGLKLEIKMPPELVGKMDIFSAATMVSNRMDSAQKGPRGLKLTKGDINRLKMAKRAAKSIEEHSNDKIFGGNPFERRCINMPDFINVLNELPLAFGFSAAAIVYGGLHALAWFAHFHSPTEQLLWRISSAVVMGGIPTFVAIWKLFFSFVGVPDMNSLIGLRNFAPLLVLSCLIAIAYVLARLYLVVECFIQLSHLPAGVYEEPEWSAYFPHIA